MYNLKIRQDHINQKVGNFGSKKLSSFAIDQMIEQEEKRIMRRRVLCNVCYEYKSVTGECSC